MSNPSPILEATNIRKTFYSPTKVEVLKDINLKVFPGETIAIMGASGEGKSTLLHILGSLESPSEGSLKIAQRSITRSNNASLRNEHIGFIFQGFHLLEDYTILENTLIPAMIARKSTKKNSESYQRVLKLIEEVKLTNRLHFSAKLLSGGEKQRVAIVRALCNNPSLILADEPTGNLDHQTSLEIIQVLLSFAKKSNKALIIVTHDIELAKMCDRILTLRDGFLHEN
jgi:lipoprotein-releasing system ATP-binding protein